MKTTSATPGVGVPELGLDGIGGWSPAVSVFPRSFAPARGARLSTIAANNDMRPSSPEEGPSG